MGKGRNRGRVRDEWGRVGNGGKGWGMPGKSGEVQKGWERVIY